MAKRKPEDPPKGSPAWMNTFSDLMNLLLCFFVLLFASSTMNQSKIEAIAASFGNLSVFDGGGGSSIGEGETVSSGISQVANLESYYNNEGSDGKGNSGGQTGNTGNGGSNSQDGTLTGAPGNSDASDSEYTKTEMAKMQEQQEQQKLKLSEQMNAEVSSLIKYNSIESQIHLNYTAEFVRISLNGGILFDSGQADLKKESIPLMSKIGDILVKYRDCEIEIEGHSDNVPLSGSGVYKNNMYLSSARAITVYEYLLNHKHLDQSKLKASGYGDTQPVASNETPEGRARNRRVEIKIYNQLSEQ